MDKDTLNTDNISSTIDDSMKSYKCDMETARGINLNMNLIKLILQNSYKK